MPKVSAILPVYGEKYIEQSLRSLLDQTLDDIEFILVDDRSPDSAYDIALEIIGEEQYAHLRDNIKIIRHDVNKGAHIVRRTGWEASTGDYIYQPDSDDLMDRDILRKLWEKAVEGDYDMVECSFWITDAEGNRRRPECPEQYIRNAYEDWIVWPGTPTYWNKLFKRSVYENEIIWPKHHYKEDYIIVSQLLTYSRTRAFIDEPLYSYFLNPAGNAISEDIRRRIEYSKEQVDILEEFMRGKGLYDRYRTRFTVMKSDILQDAWALPWREFLKVLPEERAGILTCSGVPLKTRLGHISKLLGIHGISKLFCIIAFFV
ncbi:MAG: glycosyltransferase family 2 protein [Bacteroidales bacterium]|nr:glycosyltransferase family 2 protein [Bacteroidales bacterium]